MLTISLKHVDTVNADVAGGLGLSLLVDIDAGTESGISAGDQRMRSAKNITWSTNDGLHAEKVSNAAAFLRITTVGHEVTAVQAEEDPDPLSGPVQGAGGDVRKEPVSLADINLSRSASDLTFNLKQCDGLDLLIGGGLNAEGHVIGKRFLVLGLLAGQGDPATARPGTQVELLGQLPRDEAGIGAGVIQQGGLKLATETEFLQEQEDWRRRDVSHVRRVQGANLYHVADNILVIDAMKDPIVLGLTLTVIGQGGATLLPS